MPEDKNSDLPPNPAYAQDPYFGCPERRPLNLGRYAAPPIVQPSTTPDGRSPNWYYEWGGGE